MNPFTTVSLGVFLLSQLDLIFFQKQQNNHFQVISSSKFRYRFTCNQCGQLCLRVKYSNRPSSRSKTRTTSSSVVLNLETHYYVYVVFSDTPHQSSEQYWVGYAHRRIRYYKSCGGSKEGIATQECTYYMWHRGGKKHKNRSISHSLHAVASWVHLLAWRQTSSCAGENTQHVPLVGGGRWVIRKAQQQQLS